MPQPTDADRVFLAFATAPGRSLVGASGTLFTSYAATPFPVARGDQLADAFGVPADAPTRFAWVLRNAVASDGLAAAFLYTHALMTVEGLGSFDALVRYTGGARCFVWEQGAWHVMGADLPHVVTLEQFLAAQLGGRPLPPAPPPAASPTVEHFLADHPLPWSQYNDEIGEPVRYGVEDANGQLLFLLGDGADDQARIDAVLALVAGQQPPPGSLAAAWLADHPLPWEAYEDRTGMAECYAIEDANGEGVFIFGSYPADWLLRDALVALANRLSPTNVGDSAPA